MGCDIHMFTEIKRNGTWIEGDFWCPNPDYINASEEDKKYFNPLHVPDTQRIYTAGRNYALFGVLAKVRWQSLPCISEPKGIPNNLSPNITEELRRWGQDAHTCSWYTLKELKEFDWDQKIHCVVYLDAFCFFMNQNFNKFKLENLKDDPWAYCRYDQPSNGKEVSFKKFKQLLDQFFQTKLKLSKKEYFVQKNLGSLSKRVLFGLINNPKNGTKLQFYVKYEYDPSLKSYCPEFVNDTIPKLEKLAIRPDVEDVRIVFWFDN